MITVSTPAAASAVMAAMLSRRRSGLSPRRRGLRTPAATRNHRSDPLRQGDHPGGGASTRAARLDRASRPHARLEVTAPVACRQKRMRRPGVVLPHHSKSGRGVAACHRPMLGHTDRPCRGPQHISSELGYLYLAVLELHLLARCRIDRIRAAFAGSTAADASTNSRLSVDILASLRSGILFRIAIP